MQQFFADTIDQLDLALDQLAVCDRNFDRFAMMLIDNVVELTLHKHAQSKSYLSEISAQWRPAEYDHKLIAKALGQNFDAKVRFAKASSLIPEKVADSILYLHTFRNTPYHKGLRHEGILHSLALFYFECSCELLKNFRPAFGSSSSGDVISHRAMKYLGKTSFLSNQEAYSKAWSRLSEVAEAMPADLIQDLSIDISKTIDGTDNYINFLAEDSPEPQTRKEAVINSQAWALAFTDEGREFFRDRLCPALSLSVQGHVDWLAKHYPWPVKDDPIPGWRRRADSIKNSDDKHSALKKYVDFLKQTEEIREVIDESAAQLDGHIQHQIDLARGK